MSRTNDDFWLDSKENTGKREGIYPIFGASEISFWWKF